MLVKCVNVSVILGKQFQPVVRYIIFDGDDAVEIFPI